MLFYRGQAPEGMPLDSVLPALQDSPHYPLRYGYASVGVVEQVGSPEDAEWVGRQVFAFEPHCSGFIASITNLIPTPAEMGAETAAFLPNMETAVSLVMDGAPSLGERVLVLGQGVVGLLLTSLLARFPLTQLVIADRLAHRRQVAMTMGANLAIDDGAHLRDFDLVYEVSGNPDTLNQAVAAAGNEARVVVGSWYGTKQATLDLGGHFHRSRMRLVSSQVSTLAAQHTGRWNKQRRMEVAWRMLAQTDVQKLTSHRVALSDAALAYQLIDEHSADTIQVLLMAER
jgi:threonine dehydrogenase-like Zn-dependent dehydrogenase